VRWVTWIWPPQPPDSILTPRPSCFGPEAPLPPEPEISRLPCRSQGPPCQRNERTTRPTRLRGNEDGNSSSASAGRRGTLGSSNHELGLAADLGYPSVSAERLAHRDAAGCGLEFPVPRAVARRAGGDLRPRTAPRVGDCRPVAIPVCLGAARRMGGELAMTAPQPFTRHDVERATGLSSRTADGFSRRRASEESVTLTSTYKRASCGRTVHRSDRGAVGQARFPRGPESRSCRGDFGESPGSAHSRGPGPVAPGGPAVLDGWAPSRTEGRDAVGGG
jgi:hypothetical protein